MLDEGGQRGKLQQVCELQFLLQTGLGLDLGNHLDPQQRMTAQSEEIVVGVHFFNPQSARPNGGNLFLKPVRHHLLCEKIAQI